MQLRLWKIAGFTPLKQNFLWFFTEVKQLCTNAIWHKKPFIKTRLKVKKKVNKEAQIGKWSTGKVV